MRIDVVNNELLDCCWKRQTLDVVRIADGLFGKVHNAVDLSRITLDIFRGTGHVGQYHQIDAVEHDTNKQHSKSHTHNAYESVFPSSTAGPFLTFIFQLAAFGFCVFICVIPATTFAFAHIATTRLHSHTYGFEDVAQKNSPY